MKELSTEQKAEAYDEAKARMSRAFNDNRCTIGFMNEIFPELKESEKSEDEKIRKALIHFISEQDGFLTAINGISIKDVLAWLEKQRDKDKLIQELGEYKVKYTQEVLEKHINNMNNKDEERLRKTAIAFLKEFADKGYENAVECIDWLEKQGEQKPVDKIEPKFKVGEWVIFNGNHNSVYQVERIDNYRYHLRHYLGGSLSVHFDNELIRKWTIQDAKAGDVLTTDTWLYVFKYTNNKDIIKFYCSCPINKKPFKWCFLSDESYLDIYIDANIHPATKEQRDTLMKAMVDAGYTFDFEKKELKKIEQKPLLSDFFNAEYERSKVNTLQSIEWSEEDEHMYQSIIDDTVQENQLDSKQIDWIKSLKQRIGG